MVKTTSSSVGLRVYIVVMLIGLFMTISSAGDAVTLLTKDTVNVSSKKISKYYEGEMVHGKMEFIYDTIATLETTQTVYGIPTSKKTTPYYLVYVDSGKDGEDGHYVLVHITDKDTITHMDNLMHQTQSILMSDNPELVYENVKPIAVNTKTVKIPKEVKEYLYQYFEESGMTRADCDEMVADCVLEQTDYTKAKILPFIGLGLMVLATLIFIPTKIRKKPKTTYVNEFPAGGFVPQNGNTDNANQASMMDEINTDDIFR